LKARAQALKTGEREPGPGPQPGPEVVGPKREPEPVAPPTSGLQTRAIRLAGAIPPEVWNRLGTKILPKLRSGSDLKLGIEFSVTVNSDVAPNLVVELRQILDELGLTDKVHVAEE